MEEKHDPLGRTAIVEVSWKDHEVRCIFHRVPVVGENIYGEGNDKDRTSFRGVVKTVTQFASGPAHALVEIELIL